MPAKVSESWRQYLSWLSESVPNACDALAPPASEADLAKLEEALGASLPASVREFWSLCGGQLEMDGPSLAAGFVFLSPADALREWQNWAQLRTSEGASGLESLSMHCTSSPANAIQEEYTVAGWLPLWKERLEGNYVGVDLAPGPEGSSGQVIHFGRDEDEKSVLFWDFAHLLSWLAEEAKAESLAVEEDEDDEDIQHVVHERGRVVGVLRKLAAAGDIPTGRKP